MVGNCVEARGYCPQVHARCSFEQSSYWTCLQYRPFVNPAVRIGGELYATPCFEKMNLGTTTQDDLKVEQGGQRKCAYTAHTVWPGLDSDELNAGFVYQDCND